MATLEKTLQTLRLIRNRKTGTRRIGDARGRGEAGFSLVEILVVVAIILIISAYAVPDLNKAIANIELRSAGATISGVAQQARVYAAKMNKTIGAKLTTTTDGAILVTFVDINDSGAWPATYAVNGVNYQEPGSELNRNIYLAANTDTSIPTFDSATLLGYTQAYSTTTGGTNGFAIYFNARGLPCTKASSTSACTTMASETVNGVTATTTTAGYLYFFYRQGIGGKSWSAISVTPAGRVRTWTYDGTWN